MASIIPTLEEKCRGAMLATAIGDALGWPQEIRSKNRDKNPKLTGNFVDWIRSSNNPRWHDEKILAGEYSDDTQLTLSIARSIIAGNWEKSFAEKELPFWLNYERGGGSALLRAAKSCSQNSFQPWQTKSSNRYFSAGGNGAAMRILPHVIAASKKGETTALMVDVIKDTLITHGHPRAFLGAMCYAYALDYLLKKKSVLEYGELVDAIILGREYWTVKPDSNIFGNWLNAAWCYCGYDFYAVWELSADHMLHKLETIKVSLRKGLMSDDAKMLTDLDCFGKVSGAGDVAALTAVYLASKYANNPILAIKAAAYSLGADTDTIASMTGGLVGMLNGMEWIPTEWRTVQDFNCLITMSDLLVSKNKKDEIETVVSLNKTTDSGWETTPIGKMKQVNFNSVPNGKYGQVIIKKWQTSLGQTLYTKSFQPNDNRFQHHPDDDQISFFQQDFFCNENQTSQAGTQGRMFDSVDAAKDYSDQKLFFKNTIRRFVLDSTNIESLISSSQFKQSLTVGKVIKIIQVLIENNEPSDSIAKRFKVDQSMVDLLKDFITQDLDILRKGH